MALEALVTVSWFGSPQSAAEDLAKLQKAGLNAYLGGEFHRHGGAVELRVPESEVARALEILGIDPAELRTSPEPVAKAPRCPDCGSDKSRRLPPYAFRVLVGSLVLLAATVAIGQAWIGFVGVAVAWVAAMWLSRYAGRHRCLACGRVWKPND